MLAKEAAREVSTFREGRKSTSMADVKMASPAHIMTLWQRRWDLTEVGWVFCKYFPSIDTKKRPFDQPSKDSYSKILQLQTLNDYRSKLGQIFLSFFLYILLHPLSRIMSRCTLYTPVLQDESLQVII